MKVATWRGGDRFTIDEVPDPLAGPGQVVVDVHTTQGLFPRPSPTVLGHEYSGIVRAVGRGVSRRLVGRPVACEPSYGCGDCPECAEERVYEVRTTWSPLKRRRAVISTALYRSRRAFANSKVPLNWAGFAAGRLR